MSKMNEVRKRIAKLIDVKSIMTLLLTVVFCLLSAFDKISAEKFMTVYTVVISFFFGVKSGKNDTTKE